MKYALKPIAAGAMSFALAGCFNIGTKPSEITPAFVPASQYQNESCRQLDVDRQDLYRRKTMLETAQDQRRHSNKVQAFWVGFGNGDGVGAGELAQVKGEILAVEKERAIKGCGGEGESAYAAPIATPTSASADAPQIGTWPLPLPQFDIQANCQHGSANVQACVTTEQSARNWLAHHTTTVQIAGACSQFAQQDQSYAMIQACVQQREGAAQ